MKICFAINNLCAGGAERVLSSLANEIALSTNYTIDAICFSHNYYKDRFYHFNNRVSVHLVDYNNTLEMTLLLQDIKPDIVVSFLNPMNYVVSIATRELHIPHITCERNNPYISPPKDYDRKNRDEAFKYAAGCVFQSKYAESYFHNELTGISTTILNPVILDTEYKALPKKDIILAIGRYTEQKNYFTLLKAFSIFNKKHPSFILECYGKNSGMLNDIVKYAETLDLENRVFFNEQSHKIHEKILSAKLFLMTSFHEGQPNSLMEAASLGLPCVASDIPGVTELFNQYKFGLLCPPTDAQGFSDAMGSLVNSDTLYSLCSNNGKTILKDRNITVIAKHWIEFINKVLLNAIHKC